MTCARSRAVLAEMSAVRFSTWPTIVIRSTVPPGTCDRIAPLVEEWGDLVYAPEFLREGTAVRDFLNPARIVVGARKASLAVPYVRLFEALQKPVVFTSLCNAEMVKGCSNAFLALKITYANEVANLCDALGGNADDVLRGMGYDPRIGPEFLRPGIGFGGPCFEKDVKSIRHVEPPARPRRRPVRHDAAHQRSPADARRSKRSSARSARSTARRSAFGVSRSRPAPTTSGTRSRSASSTNSLPAAR